MRASTRTSKNRPTGPAASGTPSRGFWAPPKPSAQGQFTCPEQVQSPSPPRPQESYAFLGTPTSWIGKSAATPRIWVEARVRAPPTHRLGPAPAGRRGYAATSVLGQRPKTLAQGGFTPPEQVQWAAGHQKRRTSKWMSFFFGASDEARTRPQVPRKAMLSWGPPTSWIEKSAATPRIWVEAANSSLPCPRIAWDPRQRDGVGTPSQAFWGNAPKPWRRADSLPPEHVQ